MKACGYKWRSLYCVLPLLTVFSLLLAGGCMAEEVLRGESDDGSTLSLSPGQVLLVRLPSNPTTGYRWKVVAIDEVVLKQVGEAEFTPYQTGRIPLAGAGGTELFRFRAVGPGKTTLRLEYVRPWEKGVPAVKQYALLVIVH